ncbi:MAG: glycoside hydrolase family 2 protein, partial [Calditrichaeota bacterium]|nr:glycoside hydrolase family 2 protein [Calditrichota bacterium]
MKNEIIVVLLAVMPLMKFTNFRTTMITQPEIIRKSLNDDWKFRKATKETWLPATVPGTVHTDLLALDSIGDPYYRLNEKDMQWIDKRDWEYQSEFMVSPDLVARKQISLKF